MAKKKALPPPRPEVLAFLQAIRDDRDDPTHQLVFADWLDDTGESMDALCARALRHGVRAESITPIDADYEEFREQRRTVKKELQKGWFEKICPKMKDGKLDKGLVDASFEAKPFVGKPFEKFVESEFWAWIDKVRLSEGAFEGAPAKRLANTPLLERVTTLEFAFGSISEKGMQLLVDGGVFDRLQRLKIWDCNVWRSELLVLLGKELPLRALDLGNNGIDDADLEVFVLTDSLPELTELRLRSNVIGDEGATSLANTVTLGGVRILDLDANELTGQGVREISGSEDLENLRILELSSNRFGDEGAIALAEALVHPLEKLELNGNGIGDEGAIALANCERLTDLRELNLTSNKITARGAEALARSPYLTKLETMWLASNDIGDGAAGAFAESPSMEALISLDLAHNEMTDKSVGELLSTDRLERWHRLWVYGNEIGKPKAKELVKRVKGFVVADW